METSSLSLRGRVLAWIAVVQVGLLVLLSALYLFEARHTLRIEQAAAQDAARALVLTTLGAMLAEEPASVSMLSLSERLTPLRHVRLRFFDAEGRDPAAKAEAPPDSQPPGWLSDWLAPPVKVVRIPVSAARGTLGMVVIEGAPAGEIERIWRQSIALGAVSLAALAALLLVLYGVIGRALVPLARMRDTLKAMEGGDLSARVPATRTPDLGPIAAQINRLSASLEATEAARQDLTRRLIDVQETERKHIAMELHDEMGPCLFGLSVEAEAIAGAAGPEQAQHARNITDIVGQLRQMNRRILRALRPVAVGQLPLADVLGDLVAAQRDLHPGVELTLSLGPLPETTEAQELTLYRFVQEAMTNAYRHSGSDRIDIEIQPEPGRIRAEVADHGTGIGELVPGTGLLGMQERLRASGGQLTIGATEGGGTRLTATLPLDRP